MGPQDLSLDPFSSELLRGRRVLVTRGGTDLGRPFTAASAMAKAGVQAMTHSLAVERGRRNIRLVAVAPGAFSTASGRILNAENSVGAQRLPQ